MNDRTSADLFADLQTRAEIPGDLASLALEADGEVAPAALLMNRAAAGAILGVQQAVTATYAKVIEEGHERAGSEHPMGVRPGRSRSNRA